MIGPVGVGEAEAVLIDVGVAVPVALPVALLLPLVNVVELLLNEYVFKRLGPPQYSLTLPLQVIEQPFWVGSVPPVARTEPVLNVFPQ